MRRPALAWAIAFALVSFVTVRAVVQAETNSSPEERSFTVIVEQSDPLVPNRATVSVSAEGFAVRGLVDPANVEISTRVR